MPPKKKAAKMEPASEPPKKKARKSDNAVADAVLDKLTCPITCALICRPAIAEDGFHYEFEAIEKWLKTNKKSPRTNLAMGDRLIQSSDGRALIRVAIVSGAVDDDEAICAWYVSSARHMIAGTLPGGLETAREHLDAGLEKAPSTEGALLREALELHDKLQELKTRGKDAGVDGDIERVFSPSAEICSKTRLPLSEWRGDLVPNAAVIRVIDDAEFLESLCGRAAPGGDRSVGWVDNMKKLCSRAFVVKQCKEDRKAYRINYNDANYAVPFDGCILIAKG